MLKAIHNHFQEFCKNLRPFVLKKFIHNFTKLVICIKTVHWKLFRIDGEQAGQGTGMGLLGYFTNKQVRGQEQVSFTNVSCAKSQGCECGTENSQETPACATHMAKWNDENKQPQARERVSLWIKISRQDTTEHKVQNPCYMVRSYSLGFTC